MNSTTGIRVEPLTENNWFTWSRKVTAYLKVKDVYRALEEAAPLPGIPGSAHIGVTGTPAHRRTESGTGSVGLPAVAAGLLADERAADDQTASADAAGEQRQQQLESAVASRGTGTSSATRTATVWRQTISHEEWLRVDENCLSTIELLIGTEFMHLIIDARTSREAWDSLQSYFQSQQDARQLDPIVEMSQLKMLKKESVSAYYARAQRLKNTLQESRAPAALVRVQAPPNGGTHSRLRQPA
jgi:hypothetical protein